MSSFSDNIASALRQKRHLCVGIDPHDQLLDEWHLPLSASGAEHMGRRVVEAAAGTVACVKPQIAFFERFGALGYQALERVLEDARQAQVPVIADVKRGDIGTSFAAYAEAWLSPGSPLEADAMTVVAYQGFARIQPAFDLAVRHGKGVFVLSATSNPEAASVQQATLVDGRTLASAMVDDAREANLTHFSHNTVGGIGVVLGATLDLRSFGIETTSKQTVPFLPVLAPGFGVQGAQIADAPSIFGTLGWALLANESRGVLSGDPKELEKRIQNRSDAYSRALTYS